MTDIIAEATCFITACYGSQASADMNSLRYEVWTAKMCNSKLSSAPDLKVLPPTIEEILKSMYTGHIFKQPYENLRYTLTCRLSTLFIMDGTSM